MKYGYLELLNKNTSRHFKKCNDLNTISNTVILYINEAVIYLNMFFRHRVFVVSAKIVSSFGFKNTINYYLFDSPKLFSP